MKKVGKYLYGIISAKQRESFGNIGMSKMEAYSIQFEDVSAVVSDVLDDYKMELEQAKIHDETLRKIMQLHAVIPMSFGIIAKDEEEVKNMLKRGRVKLKKTLEKVDNKLQVNVKISWDKAIFSSIMDEHVEIQKLVSQAKNNVNASLKIELGKKVKMILDEKRSEYLAEIGCSLKSLSCESEENRINDEDTLVNLAFLLDKNLERDFYGKLDELEQKYKGKLKFVAVGPLPPYNFTKLSAKKLDFEALEEARKVLGLSHEVSISEIDSAYRLLVRQFHPDLHPDDVAAEQKFKKVKNSRDLLVKYCEHYLCSLQKSSVEGTIVIDEKSN